MLETKTKVVTYREQGIYLKPSLQFKPLFEVAVVFIEYQDLVLILHRQDNKTQGNKWGIPGGKLEKNEKPRQAAVREVQEETGLDISQQLIEDLGTVYVEYNETLHFTHHMFRIKMLMEPGLVKIDFDEHKGFTWITPIDGLKMDLLQGEDACFRLVYFPEESDEKLDRYAAS